MNGIKTKLYRREFMDFELADDRVNQYCGLSQDGLAIHVDLSSGTTSLVKWVDAQTSNFDLNYISLTGLDNFFVSEPDAFTGNTLNTDIVYEVEENDRFVFHSVSGYSTNIEYGISQEQDGTHILNGGFYQGFFKLHQYPFELYPTRMVKGWTMDTILTFNGSTGSTGTTLNSLNPNNTGYIFYIGTRSENKFKPLTEVERIEIEALGLNLNIEDYANLKIDLDNDYRPSTNEVSVTNGEHVIDKYYNSFGLYTGGDEYVTASGKDYVGNYYIDDCGFRMTGKSATTTTLGMELNVIESERLYEKYPERDIISNAFGIRIRPDGRIGYKKIVKTDPCLVDSGTTTEPSGCTTGSTEVIVNSGLTKSYTVVEKYSKCPIFTANDNGKINITVTFERDIPLNTECELKYSEYKNGTLTIYVNGRVVFEDKEFEEIIPHELDTIKELQEGVPFNISWGGGTQGLYESVTFGGRDPRDLGRVLESEFAGTFDGGLNELRMYVRPLDFTEVIHNFKERKSKYSMVGDFGGRKIIITKGT